MSRGCLNRVAVFHQSSHLGAAGLDVYEEEDGFFL